MRTKFFFLYFFVNDLNLKNVVAGPSGHNEGEQGVERDRREAPVPFVSAHREPPQYRHLSELHNKVSQVLLLLFLF